MATTVTYKGQTLATVENQTKTLQTAGTWCEDDFTLTDVTSGGGISVDGIATNTEPSGAITLGVTSIGDSAFYAKTGITSVDAPLVTSIGISAFQNCSGLLTVIFPNVTAISNNAFYGTSSATSMKFPSLVNCPGAQAFNGCTAILVFPKLKITNVTNVFSTYKGRIIDFGEDFYQMNSWTFNGMGNNSHPLNIMIFRRTSGLVSIASMSGFPPYQYGANGSGGTVYIPKVFYDHLGDGTSLDYLNATNWSTFMSYNANNTFACIEGSIYETQYADGTVIE